MRKRPRRGVGSRRISESRVLFYVGSKVLRYSGEFASCSSWGCVVRRDEREEPR